VPPEIPESRNFYFLFSKIKILVLRQTLKLGHDVFQGWLDLFGAGDGGERLGLDDGRAVRRLADLHRREIRNVFARFELRRAVYGSRAGQAIEAVPLDERLRLPPGKNSYLLQDGDQEMTMEKPFVHVSAAAFRGSSASANRCTPWSAISMRWPRRSRPFGHSARSPQQSRTGRSSALKHDAQRSILARVDGRCEKNLSQIAHRQRKSTLAG
jgi:hypothetical protein